MTSSKKPVAKKATPTKKSTPAKKPAGVKKLTVTEKNRFLAALETDASLRTAVRNELDRLDPPSAFETQLRAAAPRVKAARKQLASELEDARAKAEEGFSKLMKKAPVSKSSWLDEVGEKIRKRR